jgi:hypothetical protein
MYRLIVMSLVALLCACAATPIREDGLRDNSRLIALFEEDQSARSTKEIDWSVVDMQDEARRDEVLSLLKKGQVHTAHDFYNAAVVFQHGETADDVRLAFSLAWISASLEPEIKEIRWLSAAAWDRIMMREHKPQWYGTQFTKPKDAPWELYQIDESAVSDKERAGMGVPSLSDAKAHVKELNQ